MNDTDHQLLAQKLRVSRGTVQNRLSKLEESGVIAGYTVRLKPEAEPHRIRAWTGIAVEGNHAAAVLKALRGEPGVHTRHSTTGRWDFMAQLRADNLEGLDRVLGRVRRIDGIGNTETSILLSTHKL